MPSHGSAAAAGWTPAAGLGFRVRLRLDCHGTHCYSVAGQARLVRSGNTVDPNTVDPFG